MTVQEYKSPIAQLAEVLDGRGYEVNLGKSFGGEACEILADTEGGHVGVRVVDFGRDPVGRVVDIRWVSRNSGNWNFVESAIDAEKLADRVIATL